jgi:hypothetical protein
VACGKGILNSAKVLLGVSGLDQSLLSLFGLYLDQGVPKLFIGS